MKVLMAKDYWPFTIELDGAFWILEHFHRRGFELEFSGELLGDIPRDLIKVEDLNA